MPTAHATVAASGAIRGVDCDAPRAAVTSIRIGAHSNVRTPANPTAAKMALMNFNFNITAPRSLYGGFSAHSLSSLTTLLAVRAPTL